MKYYYIVDLGTGNSRVCLTDETGQIISARSVSNEYLKDDAYPDSVYFEPAAWEEKILGMMEALAGAYPDIQVEAISCAGARQSAVLIDDKGEAFYSLPNIDNRGKEWMDTITDKQDAYRRSGKWVTEDFVAAKMLGLRMGRPELYERIHQVISISEWIGWIFTRKIATEPSQACEMGLYDIDSKGWSSDLANRYGISEDMLPPLVNAGEILGPVLPKLKERMNLAEDAVFIIGGADTQLAIRQTDADLGDLTIVSGTTSPVVMKSLDRIYDEQQRIWVDADLGADNYLIEMNPGVTGLNYQRFKEHMCPDISYEELEKSYAERTDFKCTASFSSLLFYEQRSLRNGGFYMHSPLGPGVDRFELAYAMIGDIACSIYEQLYRLRELTKHSKEYVYGCGGGLRSPALCQAIADLTGLELRIKPGYEQATVIGLVRIMNETMNCKQPKESGYEPIIYRPHENSLIHRYYPVWLENRNRENH